MSQRHDAPVIPGFTFVKHIGSGGFADVFLFEQHLPARKVAVKVLAATAPGEAVLDQFHAEANVMAQLSGHSAIVAIHAADVSSDSRPYIVMEYCPPPTHRADQPRRGSGDGHPDRRCRRDRPPRRHSSSRRQAAQHPHQQLRRTEAHRLRHRRCRLQRGGVIRHVGAVVPA
jgi:serine/threonine protein kinase